MKPETYQQQMKRLQKRTRRNRIIKATGSGNGLNMRQESDNSFLKYWLKNPLLKAAR